MAGDEGGGCLGGGGIAEDGPDAGVALLHGGAVVGVGQQAVEFGFHILLRKTGGNQFLDDLVLGFPFLSFISCSSFFVLCFLSFVLCPLFFVQ